jgi:ATP-binding cassette subfamily B protein
VLIRILGTYLRPYRRKISVLLLLLLVQTIAMLLLPTLTAAIVDRGLVTGDTGYILHAGTVMLGMALVQLVAYIGAQHVGSHVAMGLGRDLRRVVFRRVQDFSTLEISRFGTASLTTRTLNDVQQVQTLALEGFNGVLTAPIMWVVSVVLALRQSVLLTGVLLLLVPTTVLVAGLIILRLVPLFHRIQRVTDQLNGVLREQVTGVRVVRAFVRDEHERSRFGRVSTDLYQLGLRAGRLRGMMFPAIVLVGNVSTVAVIWAGGHLVDTGLLEVGGLSAFLGYLILVLTSMVIAIYAFIDVPRARVSARRIHDVLSTEPSMAPGTRRCRDGGRLELRGVEFRHLGAEAPFLQDIDLSVGRGERVAIIGSTGSGKTTLLNLVLRLADVTSGAVLVNGVDVRELDTASIARTVGLVPQRPVLFSGTVASNLRYGAPHATDADLWHALEVTQALDFVAAMPGDLNARIAQGGTNISGGQRQRLSIARTLLRRPEIYLLDDCFSALDYTTDARLRAALATETEDATMITVAQRVSTIEHANLIVVLNEGRIVGTGTHDELLRSNEPYREIARSQPAAEQVRQ